MIFINMKKILLKVLKEQEENGYFKITPKDYLELMKLSGYHEGVTKIKKFQNKPLWITGNLDISNTPTVSLGNVAKIDGNLNINYTKIQDISGIDIKGYVSDSNTPIERKRIAAEIRKKREEAQERRESGEWDIENTDDEGLKANALFNWLVGQNEIEEVSDEEKEELEDLKKRYEDLNEKYDECEENCDELYDEINDIEDRMSEIEEKTNDVYNISPMKYQNYGLSTFEIIGIEGLRDREYCVGTESEMDDAVREYAESYISEVGLQSFNKSFLENHIDEDYLRNYITDWITDDIWQSPESYFTDDDYKLTEEQEYRIEELQSYIESLEEYIERMEEEQNDLEGEIEDPDEYSKRYEDIQNMIDDAESKKDEAQDELDGIEPDTEPTQEMVDEKLEERLDDIMNNPILYIQDYGLDINNFVDTEKIAESLIRDEGYGLMSHYDGSYDVISLEGEDYYIMRTN